MLPTLAGLALLAAAVASLFLGKVNLSPGDVLAGLFAPHASLAGQIRSLSV